MIQPVIKIEVYKKQLTSGADIIYYNSSPEYIMDDFINLNISRGIKKRKDKISFVLQNHYELNDDGSYTYTLTDDLTIGIKDLIKVYAWNANEDGSMPGVLNDHHIMTAYVKNFGYNSTEGEGTYNITCFNRTEVILNSFMFQPYNKTEQVPIMIVDSINKVRSLNINDNVYAYTDYKTGGTPGTKGAYDASGNQVYYELDSVTNRKTHNTSGIGTAETGYIRAYKKGAYKTDGSGELLDIYSASVPSEFHFDKVAYVEAYKPFIEHLEELSTDKFTGDVNAGIYVNSVDENNNLHWEPKSFIIVDTVNEGEHTSITLNKDVDQVVNAVIINAGIDPNNIGVLSLSYNTSSMGLNGARWAYKGKNDIADSVKENEIKSGTYEVDDEVISTGQNAIINSNYRIGDDDYPVDESTGNFPSSWIVQTSGDDVYGGWSYVAGTTTVTSRKDYRKYFRRVVKRMGEKIGDSIVQYSGDPLFKGSWELENGNLTFSPNQMLTVDVPSLDLNETLRIVTINDTFSGGDWKTTLELEEDLDYNLKAGI